MRSNTVVLFLVVVVIGLASLAVALASRSNMVPGGNRPPNPGPFEHVMDSTKHWHLFESVGRVQSWELPIIFGTHRLTKFMILELVAAIVILVIYVPLARQLQSGEPARGLWQNAFEWPLTFIRDEVAKPNLGEHDADRYLPFLWTMALFILICNLLGMIPFAGSPTASIYVTGALALCSFIAIQIAAVAKLGLIPYLKSLWPHLDIPIPVAGFIIKFLIFVIELVGTVIKSSVLAVRLFANMFAGHTVLAVIMLFVVMAANASLGLWVSITVSSVLGVVALSLLELFVAFLQTYIFVFLTALFMGMALHPQH
jgi:F-type H+-transporting ATPase subunit a